MGLVDNDIALVQDATERVRSWVHGLDDDALRQPSLLPGWTRGHVVAHLVGNAEGMVNLVTWAVTGVRTPMYPSMDQRNADIQARSTLSAVDLQALYDDRAATLRSRLAELTEAVADVEIVNGIGQVMPARRIPWLRAREVLIHGVDLDAGLAFIDLPPDFLARLLADIVSGMPVRAGESVDLDASDAPVLVRVAGDGDDVITVAGPLGELVALVLGRPAHGLAAAGSSGPVDVPVLPSWS